jgi:hypothetical protein
MQSPVEIEVVSTTMLFSAEVPVELPSQLQLQHQEREAQVLLRVDLQLAVVVLVFLPPSRVQQLLTTQWVAVAEDGTPQEEHQEVPL